VSTAVAVGFLGMWPAGHFRYTSIGLDRETLSGADRVQMDYFRVRWPGNGDVWVGGGGHERPLAAGSVEPFDPASAIFIRHHPPPEPRSAANRWGWWYLPDPKPDPSGRPNPAPLVWGWWVGVPGWLPAVLFGIWPAWLWLRLRRARTGPGEPPTGASPGPSNL
jgi:hypothetical protein